MYHNACCGTRPSNQETRARTHPSNQAVEGVGTNSANGHGRPPNRTKIRILLADDHVLTRRGLRTIFEEQPEFEVVGEAADGREAVVLAESLRPDVAVLDLTMPNLNGIEAARQMIARGLCPAVVILGARPDEGFILRAFKAGARAYVLKEAPEADFVQAILSAVEGKAFLSPSAGRMVMQNRMEEMQKKGVEDTYDLLTAREREVLQLVAEGKSNKEAAAVLNLSLHTVETHRSNILTKLGIHSVPELILYAVRKGVID